MGGREVGEVGGIGKLDLGAAARVGMTTSSTCCGCAVSFPPVVLHSLTIHEEQGGGGGGGARP